MLNGTIEELNLETTTQKVGQAVKEVSGNLGGLAKVAKVLGRAIIKAFDFSDAVTHVGEALTASGKLDKQLLVLRLSLGRLKSALGEAVAPIAGYFLPMIQRAVYEAIRLVKNIALVTQALFGGADGGAAMAASQEQVAKSSAKAVRSLASFDEIERLSFSGGSGSVTEELVTIPKLDDPLTPQLQSIVDKIRSLMAKLMSLIEPLKRIDLSPAARALSTLGQAAAGLGRTLGEKLEKLWHSVLVPLAKWTVEEAAPAGVNLLTGAFTALHGILSPLLEGLQGFLPALAPVGTFLGETLTGILGGLTQLLTGLGQAFTQEGERIRDTFSALGETVSQVWAWIAPAVRALADSGEAAISQLTQTLRAGTAAISQTCSGLANFLAGVFTADWNRAWEGLKTAASGVLEFLKAVFLNDWKNAWNSITAAAAQICGGLKKQLADPLNGIIGFINSLLSGITSGINAMIRGLNKLSFTVPKWVPVLGGESFGFNLSTVKTPQIPYLAQGAVLPANKPFLAVVGDQKSGTNVEAPISVIQEALANVLAAQGQQEIAIRFTGDLAQLGRVLKPVIDRENRRVGTSLVKGAY